MGIILIQRLSVLFDYPCGSFFHFFVCVKCVGVWMVVVLSMGLEPGSTRLCSISIIPWSVIASKKMKMHPFSKRFSQYFLLFLHNARIRQHVRASLFHNLLSFHPQLSKVTSCPDWLSLINSCPVCSLQSCRHS